MARNRQIYQSDLLYVGPTGANSVTGSLTGVSPTNLIAELYRVQRADYNWSKQLQDVNQFGELAAIDRVSLQAPTVSLTYSYLTSNFINEKLIGLNVSKSGDAAEVSALSGVLSSVTDSKNYFIKTTSEGSDAIDNSTVDYNVLAIGNGFLSSYTAQGAVGGFPSVDITVEGLNINGDLFSAGATSNVTPAVNPTDGTAITSVRYTLPTGLTSVNNSALTASEGLSVIKPGDITVTLGLNAGDGLVNETDMKIQSYNISFNLNREDLSKLGSKYAFAKLPQFPVQCTMSVTAIVGDFQTGALTQIVNNNTSFNPSVVLKRGDTSAVIAKYTIKNAKLDNQDFSSSIGANKSVTMNFITQMGGPTDTTNGLFLSGITL